MHQVKSLVLGVALGLAAIGAVNVHAQDRPGDQRDQGSNQGQREQPAERAPSRPEREGRPENERAPDQGDNDPARFRRAHPGAAARCHDGFFTRTADRSRACSKHGGIDVWLAL